MLPSLYFDIWSDQNSKRFLIINEKQCHLIWHTYIVSTTKHFKICTLVAPNEKKKYIHTITFVPLILQLREMHFRSLINQQLFVSPAETYFPQISGVHARFFVDIHLISPHQTAANRFHLKLESRLWEFRSNWELNYLRLWN